MSVTWGHVEVKFGGLSCQKHPDYIFLRKAFPVWEGQFLKIPQGHQLPNSVSSSK